MRQINLRTVVDLLILVKGKDLGEPSHIGDLMKISLVNKLCDFPLLVQTGLLRLVCFHDVVVLKYLFLELFGLVCQIDHFKAIQENLLFNIQFLLRVIIEVRRAIHAYKPWFAHRVDDDFKREDLKALIEQLVLRLEELIALYKLLLNTQQSLNDHIFYLLP